MVTEQRSRALSGPAWLPTELLAPSPPRREDGSGPSLLITWIRDSLDGDASSFGRRFRWPWWWCDAGVDTSSVVVLMVIFVGLSDWLLTWWIFLVVLATATPSGWSSSGWPRRY